MEIRNISRLVVAIFVCQMAGIVGSVFTRPSIATWYANLQNPTFTPPNWLFAPVWTILWFCRDSYPLAGDFAHNYIFLQDFQDSELPAPSVYILGELCCNSKFLHMEA